MSLAVAVAGGAATAVLLRVARTAAVDDRVRALRAPRSRALPVPVQRRLLAALDDAALEVEPVAAVRLWLLAAVVGVALGWAVVPGLALPAGGAVLAAGPVGLHLARHRRRRAVSAAVPALLERVAAELRSGGTVVQALTRPAPEGALAADLATLARRVSLGTPLVEALRAWAHDCDAPGVAPAAGSFAVAAALGGAAADPLDGLASSLRARSAVVAEARALATQARWSAAVMIGLPLASLAWSALLDPAGLRALLGTTVGRGCLAAGLVLDVLAAAWMRRILRIDA